LSGPFTDFSAPLPRGKGLIYPEGDRHSFFLSFSPVALCSIGAGATRQRSFLLFKTFFFWFFFPLTTVFTVLSFSWDFLGPLSRGERIARIFFPFLLQFPSPTCILISLMFNSISTFFLFRSFRDQTPPLYLSWELIGRFPLPVFFLGGSFLQCPAMDGFFPPCTTLPTSICVSHSFPKVFPSLGLIKFWRPFFSLADRKRASPTEDERLFPPPPLAFVVPQPLIFYYRY